MEVVSEYQHLSIIFTVTILSKIYGDNRFKFNILASKKDENSPNSNSWCFLALKQPPLSNMGIILGHSPKLQS